MEKFFRQTKNYRLWIDEQNTGHIRILKRSNFKTIVSIFEELYGEIKKEKCNDIKIEFYISNVLFDELSKNSKEFLEFCQTCIGIKFNLILLKLKK